MATTRRSSGGKSSSSKTTSSRSAKGARGNTSGSKSSSSSKNRGSEKRELIDTGRDKRYVKRDTKGQFKESDDMGRSLSQDRRRHAKKKVKSGYGDQGDK